MDIAGAREGECPVDQSVRIVRTFIGPQEIVPWMNGAFRPVQATGIPRTWVYQDMDKARPGASKESSICDNITPDDYRKLVMLPPDISFNEWLASHAFALFHHVNVLYGSLSCQFCTPDTCPSMLGLNNVQFSWVDDRGKKSKCTAAQYVDYVMSFLEKSVHDETLFPTKYGQEFPGDFTNLVKRMVNLMSHVLSHILHSHRLHILRLTLESQLCAAVEHLTTFAFMFSLLDPKTVQELQTGLAPLRHQMRPHPERHPPVGIISHPPEPMEKEFDIPVPSMVDPPLT